MNSCLLLFLALTALLLPECVGAQAALTSCLPYRWVWTMHNLAADTQVIQLQAVMRRAQATGFNGIVLSDYKFNIIDRMDAHYFANVEKVKATAKELGLDLYPTVCSIGYSNGLLAHDPNLAEGLPVKDALFVARGGHVELSPDPAAHLVNGDFMQFRGNTMTGWDFQDSPGKSSFVDSTALHDGHPSLRWENVGAADPQAGHGRIMQTVSVAPFRQYHLSVWAKTADLEAPEAVRALVLTPDGKSLTFGGEWHLEKTKDWSQYHLVFNSLANRKILVYLGAWGGKGGRLWWNDARLEETGLVNVLRRPGCPLTVQGRDSTLYTEGVDFAPIKDDRMGDVPWDSEFEAWHAPPALKILPKSRIKEGQNLRVSFYATVVPPGGQVTACLSDPKVDTLMRDEITRLNTLFHPKGFFMSHDEIRIANWCETCAARQETPGRLLADNTRRCVVLIRAVSPKSHLFVWSDMFDPSHNAHADYYLVNGTWAGSWEGLARDIAIVNWNQDKRKESLPFIAGRGHAQILAGYYDGLPQSIRPWLDDANSLKVPGIKGVMYTTWGANYADLEAFAQAAWGRKSLH